MGLKSPRIKLWCNWHRLRSSVQRLFIHAADLFISHSFVHKKDSHLCFQAKENYEKALSSLGASEISDEKKRDLEQHFRQEILNCDRLLQQPIKEPEQEGACCYVVEDQNEAGRPGETPDAKITHNAAFPRLKDSCDVVHIEGKGRIPFLPTGLVTAGNLRDFLFFLAISLLWLGMFQKNPACNFYPGSIYQIFWSPQLSIKDSTKHVNIWDNDACEMSVKGMPETRRNNVHQKLVFPVCSSKILTNCSFIRSRCDSHT